MRVRSIRVKNYRSILDENLEVGSLTALVGRNGAGKSAFLNALELFYSSAPQLADADFHSENADEPIEITVTFESLNSEEQERYRRYVQDESMAVVGVFRLESGKTVATYHGDRLQHLPFVEVRKESNGMKRRTQYNQLVGDSLYSELSTATTVADAERFMEVWEAEHPDECTRRRDDGQFFGWRTVGWNFLIKRTQLIRIPAVRDAGAEATEGKGSAISEIMNLVVRKVLADDPAIKELKERMSSEFEKIMGTNARPRLETLQNDLTGLLGSYAPDTSVALNWRELPQLEIADPQTDVRLHEDGYAATVDRTGHGLQRALIFALLQHLSSVKQSEDQGTTTSSTESEEPEASAKPSEAPDLIIAIDEPELYQHPSRQRHLSKVLLDLSQTGISGVAASAQVVYTTHSPLFVGLDRFDDVRILRKQLVSADSPRATSVASTSMDEVAQQLKAASQASNTFSEETLRPRLHALMTPVMNEGFFADTVVLVEGEGDEAAIHSAAQALGHDLDAAGIAVIPCGGKDKLGRPLAIFQRLGIPTYVVWDGDKGGRNSAPEANHRLLRLLGHDVVDWPSHIDETSACFEKNLDDTLEEETDSEFYEQTVDTAKHEFGYSRQEARKNALVIRRIVERSVSPSRGSQTLRSIVNRIMDLRTSVT